MFGSCLEGVWKLSERCLAGVWWLSEGCLKDVGTECQVTECRVDWVPSDWVPSDRVPRDRVPSVTECHVWPCAKWTECKVTECQVWPSSKYDRAPSVTEFQVWPSAKFAHLALYVYKQFYTKYFWQSCFIRKKSVGLKMKQNTSKQKITLKKKGSDKKSRKWFWIRRNPMWWCQTPG